MRISEQFPSKHLSTPDLQQDGDSIVTIRRVDLEQMRKPGDNGAMERKPVVYFNEFDKGLILNVTNAAAIKRALGGVDETDEWTGRKVALFTTRIKAFGEWADVIRVRERAPSAGNNGQQHPAGNGTCRDNGHEATRVLGELGRERLLTRLRELGKSWEAVLVRLKGLDLTIHEQCSGVALEDLPASCLPAIAEIVNGWAAEQKAAGEEVRRACERTEPHVEPVHDGYPEITESDIPF